MFDVEFNYGSILIRCLIFNTINGLILNLINCHWYCLQSV